jgi:peptidyl-prolyl cis-trans isomerase SurA
MNRGLWKRCLLGTILLLMGSWRLIGQLAPAGIPVNGMAAVVNDHVITYQEIQLSARRAVEAAMRQGRFREDELRQKEQEILRDSLDQLIDRRLILDEFTKSGYSLPDSVVNEIIQAQMREQFGDRVTLMKTLRKMGQRYEEYRQDQKEAFIIHSMTMKNVNQNVFVSPTRIEKYYAANTERFKQEERAKIRMIVIDKSKHAIGEPMKIAEEAEKRVKAGEDFSKVADEVSDDARRFKGGDRGWVENKDSDLRKELRSFVFAAKSGDVSGIQDLGGAIFITKVEERKSAGMRPLSEVRNEIEQTLKSEEMERLRKQWVARLRKNSFIRYFN